MSYANGLEIFPAYLALPLLASVKIFKTYGLKCEYEGCFTLIVFKKHT